MAHHIETEALTKLYGRQRGVEELTLAVGPGEVFGFLGPNGAGKTTTIRLLMDLIRPTSGTIRVLGYDLRRNPVQARRRVGYLPGDLVGAATGKRGAAIAAGAGFAVVSYFIDSLAEITSVVRPWRVVSIFHQASATGALRGDLGVAGPLATAAFAAACLLAAWCLFTRRDLAA